MQTRSHALGSTALGKKDARGPACGLPQRIAWCIACLSLVVSILGAAGCHAFADRSITEAQIDDVIARSRTLVLASGLIESEEERQAIITGRPSMAYDYPNEPYAEYRIYWRASWSKVIVVRGKGSILLLKNPAVEKMANQALQTTPMTRSVYEKTSEIGRPQRGV